MNSDDPSLDVVISENPEDLVLALFVMRNKYSEMGERMAADYNNNVIKNLSTVLGDQVFAYNSQYVSASDKMYQMMGEIARKIGKRMGLDDETLIELDTKSYEYSS